MLALGKEFPWWQGVVEDLNDPLKLGRVRVRIFSDHSSDLLKMPVTDLPWAMVMRPITDAATGDIGASPTGILKGTWVIGFYMDGEDRQRPMVMGTTGGIPVDAPDPSVGFNDPNGVYPYRLNEPDVSRLARNDTEYPHDILAFKEQTRETNIGRALDAESYEVPASTYAAEYPKNHVYESERGHVMEYDDTTGAERIHQYHRTGTFYEIDANGTKVTRIVNDNYEVVAGDNYCYVKGSCHLTIDANATTLIRGNWDIQVGQDLTIDVAGKIDIDSVDDIDIDSGDSNGRGEGYVYINSSGAGGAVIIEFVSPGGSENYPIVERGDTGTLGSTTEGAPITPIDVTGGPFNSATTEQSPEGSGVTEAVETTQAPCTDRSDLGSVSSRYESNGNPAAIGYDRTGGYSYGTYQIASNVGSMNNYLKFLDNRYPNYAQELRGAGGDLGARNGSTEFKDKWKELSSDPGFAKSQHDFIQASHFDVAEKNIQSATGLDICSRSNGLQDAVWSTAVQHGPGGANRIVQRALARTGKSASEVTDQELINAIYDERGADNGQKYFGSSTSSVRNSVVRRFESERKQALNLSR